MKSHLKEVGGSGQDLPRPPPLPQYKSHFQPLEPECKRGHQRGLRDPRFWGRQVTMGGKGSSPQRELFFHSVISGGSQNPSVSPLFPFCNLSLICSSASCFLQATLIAKSSVRTESSSLLSEDTYRGWNRALRNNFLPDMANNDPLSLMKKTHTSTHCGCCN